MIDMPSPAQLQQWQKNIEDNESSITPRPTRLPLVTPGLQIGTATPGIIPMTPAQAVTSPSEFGSSLEKRTSYTSNGRLSGDYFSTNPPPPNSTVPKATPSTAPDAQAELPQSPGESSKESKGLFGKKFRMSFPRKIGRTSTDIKAPTPEDKSEESDKSSEREDRVIENSFFGTIQKIRNDYEEYLASHPNRVPASGITPSLANESPLINPPPHTTLLIQEDRLDAGGEVDLYRGTVGTAGQDADLIEKVAPMWLGDLLLRNQIPAKEAIKQHFILHPYESLLPVIAHDDDNPRLTANKMVRARKVLSYVEERLPALPPSGSMSSAGAKLKPEEYLELLCQGQVVPMTMTLATVKTFLWRSGGDVVLYYRSNGRVPGLEKLLTDAAAAAAATTTPKESGIAGGTTAGAATGTAGGSAGGVGAEGRADAGEAGMEVQRNSKEAGR